MRRCVNIAVVLLGTLLIGTAACQPAVAQEGVDSQQAKPDWIERHSPQRALRRAAIVPAWGQVYNRQYLKVPVVYAALGGLIYNVVRLNDRYLLYRHAYQFRAYEELTAEGEINPKANLEPDYSELRSRLGISGDLSSSSIKPVRDNLRRNRDLSILGAGLVYGLSILDAFVSAHLLEFDVGDDLIVSLEPGTQGLRTTVRLSL